MQWSIQAFICAFHEKLCKSLETRRFTFMKLSIGHFDHFANSSVNAGNLDTWCSFPSVCNISPRHASFLKYYQDKMPPTLASDDVIPEN